MADYYDRQFYEVLGDKVSNYYSTKYGYNGSVTIPPRLFDDLEDRLGNGDMFTPENPYYQQMFLAQNKDDLVRLHTAAIEWEANNQQYERQLFDQERLRDEERAYQDPRAQIARQRAAGLNPDIAGGSGASAGAAGGSHTQAPAMSDTQVEGLRDNQELLQTVFSGAQAVGSVVSSLTSTFNGLADFAYAVKTFGDRTGMSKDAARVSRETADARISSAQSLAQVQALSKVQQYAQHFTDLSDVEGVRADMQALGIDDPDAMITQLQRYHQSPQMRAYVDGLVKSANEAQAAREQFSYDYYDRLYSSQCHTSLLRAQGEAIVAKFDTLLNELTLTEDAAALEASIVDDDRTARATEQQHRVEAVRRNYDAFRSSIKAIDDTIEYLRAEMLHYNNIGGKDADAYVESCRLAILNLQSLRTEQFNSLSVLLNRSALNSFDAEYNISEGSGIVPAGRHNWFNKNLLNWFSTDYWKSLFTSPENSTGSGAALDYVGNIIEMLISKKVPAVKAVKASNAVQ